MTSLADRLRAIRSALVASGALVAVGATLSWLAWQSFHDKTAAARERAALENRIRQETLAMRATEQDARAFVDAYDRLAKARIVGSWMKLDAIDQFEAALRPWQGRVGRYTVTVAPAVADASTHGIGTHRSSRARFSVELQPRHEPDLLAALEAASHGPIGTADVERCEISRRGADNDDALAASCTLAWHFFEPTQPMTRGMREDAGQPSIRSARISNRDFSLDRLFLTSAMRRTLDQQGVDGAQQDPGAQGPRSRATSAATAATAPLARRVQGYLRRSGGPDVVWIDDNPSILGDPGALTERDASVRPGARLDPLIGRGLRRTAPAGTER